MVLLYLCELVALMALFAFAFHVGFSAQNPHFSTVPRSILALFSMVRTTQGVGAYTARGSECSSAWTDFTRKDMLIDSDICRGYACAYVQGFAEDWSIMDGGGSGVMVTLFLVFYTLFSIVLLNLFIGTHIHMK